MLLDKLSNNFKIFLLFFIFKPVNVLAASLFSFDSFIREYSNIILIAAIVIIVLIIGYIWIDKLAFFEENIVNLEETRGDYYPEEYYKDIPYDGPFEDLYILIKNSGCVENGDPVGNIINSYLYKWYLSDNIKLKKIDNDFDLHPRKFFILSRPKNMGPIEKKIFEYFSETCEIKDNGYFQKEELEKYLKKNKRRIKSIFNMFRYHSFDALKEKGYLEDYEYEKSFGNITTIGTELRLTEKGQELFKNIIKFYNYLYDYNNLDKDEEEYIKWKDFFLFSSLYARELNFYKSIKDSEYFKSNKFITGGKIDKFRSFSYDFSEIVERATGYSEVDY